MYRDSEFTLTEDFRALLEFMERIAESHDMEFEDIFDVFCDYVYRYYNGEEEEHEDW